MKDYRSYNLQDFLLDESFRAWVQGDDSNDVSFWYSFLEHYPEKTSQINQAERIIRAVGKGNHTISEKDIRAEVESLLDIVSLETQPIENTESTPKNRFRSYKWLPWLVAACIAAYLLVIPSVTEKLSSQQAPEANFTTISNLVKTDNDTDKPLRIVLSDNSVVILSPSSSLQYPSNFSDTSRSVHLMGEAIFSVEKGEIPFVVYAGDVVTKVLGTKFVVRAFSNDRNTTVQVQNGTVSVFKNDHNLNKTGIVDNSGLIIKANQAVVFEKKKKQLTKTLVSDPLKLSRTIDPESMRYDEVPITEILDDLEKTYGIVILVIHERFEKCKITATLSNENMYQKLDMLCKSIGARYEIVDGQIVILGKGC